MTAVEQWSAQRANTWYASQPWLVGCNFIPSTAVNQLEMWQAETFDAATIGRELGWAAGMGFNTVRTYLHDLAWHADAEGFKSRLDAFLGIATGLGIRPILVFFDDCWNSNPHTGPQPTPKPRIHNSGWVQSPGLDVVNSGPAAWPRLEQYVQDIIGSFATDPRVLLWDLYNEPGNGGNGSRSLPLLQAAFKWARAVDPAQPLTAGLWYDIEPLTAFQLAASDVITFHHYGPAPDLEAQIAHLKQYGRPLICTEWMARTVGSRARTHLPIFAREHVSCVNWGLVAGKTNTIYPWQGLPGSSEDAAAASTGLEPRTWFHDLLRPDGSPYDPAEIELFRKYARQGSRPSVAA